MEQEITSFWLYKKTKQRLDSFISGRETQDEFINRLLDEIEANRKNKKQ